LATTLSSIDESQIIDVMSLQGEREREKQEGEAIGSTEEMRDG